MAIGPPARGRRLRAPLRAALLAVALVLATASGAGAITITELPATVAETGGMALGSDGNLWVATATGLTRMAPDGTVTGTFALPTPSHLTSGPDGALWFSQPWSNDATQSSLGRFTTSGAYREWSLNTPTAAVGGLAGGADGNLWLSQTSRITRVALPGGLVSEFSAPGSGPGAIARGPDGRIWLSQGASPFLRFDTSGTKTQLPLTGAATALAFVPGGTTGFYVAGDAAVGRVVVDGAGGATTAQVTDGLTPAAALTSIAAGADGNGWFTESAEGQVGRITHGGRIDEYSAGIALHGTPSAIVRGAGPTLWFADTYNSRIGRITLDAPQALTGEPSAITPASGTLSAVVLPRGAATSAHFEYGATTAYGASTQEQEVGDGDATAPVSAAVTGLAPATTYHYRIVATSPVGTAGGADRTFTTATQPVLPPPPPPPPAPAPDADGDGDGYPDVVDCGPLDAAVHAGATEVPGNAVDEDCAGGPAPYPRFFPRTDVTFDNHGRRFSVFTRMTISDVPAGASFRLACSGKGCGFATWSAIVPRATKRLNLLARLKRSHLRPHAVVELRLTRPGQIATVVRWTVGPPPRPAVTCLYPGAEKTQRCPR
jgi:virginiamycin B lyase